jgi:mRNA degradation ribonuclease J1/J2
LIELMTHADVPRPGSDRLVLYLLGPGFGESQIVAFPDGKWMVVDCGVRTRSNWSARLLRHLGCQKIDLLVITHPDIDHIRGIPELIKQFSVERVWRYPSGRSLRDLLARWTEQETSKRKRRLAEVRDLHSAIKNLIEKRNIVREVSASTRSWPPGDSPYRVTCIAPTRSLYSCVAHPVQQGCLPTPKQHSAIGPQEPYQSPRDHCQRAQRL